jgi:ribonuclease P protein component
MAVATGFRFTRELHVRKEWEFRRVYRTGGRSQGRFLSVVVCRNRLPHSRLGLSVGKKVGGSVRRSKIKRLIRESYRLTRWEIEARSGGVDVVVVPLQPAGKYPLAELMAELPLLVEKAAQRQRPGKGRTKGRPKGANR